MTREEALLAAISDRVELLEKQVELLTQKLKEYVVPERQNKRVQGKSEK